MKGSPERVIVTGGAGFIGSNLCRFLLDEGYSVTIIDNLSAGLIENIPEGAEFLQKDICEPGLERYFEGASTLFHLAAKNCLADCAADPVETARINVMGTANVLGACLKQGIRHLNGKVISAVWDDYQNAPAQSEKLGWWTLRRVDDVCRRNLEGLHD